MATTINSNTTDGIIITPDLSGEIKLQSDGTDIATVTSSGITMASGKSVSGGEIIQNAGPTFSAKLSTDPQTITTRTWTKVQCGTEQFDTNSDYDSTTNYRFTPSVEGYYQINGIVRATGTSQDTYYVSIYKNGSAYTHVNSRTATSGSQSLSISAVIYLNGSTDYVELYGWLEATSPQFESATVTTFSGHLARAV